MNDQCLNILAERTLFFFDVNSAFPVHSFFNFPNDSSNWHFACLTCDSPGYLQILLHVPLLPVFGCHRFSLNACVHTSTVA